MSYKPTPTVKHGGKEKAYVYDDIVMELLNQILATLKKMELHLSAMTGEEFEEEDYDN